MENNTMAMPSREMTYGEKAVGLTFNPSGNKNVQKVKELYAEIIDVIKTFDKDSETGGVEYEALKVEAIRQAQTAQMWAVKAITYQF